MCNPELSMCSFAREPSPSATRSAAPGPASRHATRAPAGTPLLLRSATSNVRPSCACGGGCPRCQETANLHRDVVEDPIHRPLIDEFRRREGLPPGGRDEEGRPVGPSEGEMKYGGLLLPCPASTEVARAIDMRADGLAAGFRTAYGIHTQMRVRPDARTWDGTQITESLTMGANTCPDTLTRGEPCSGSSTFTVGAASGNSTVLPAPRPGAINRFWDFHTTQVRPRTVSVLHDATRNPAGLNACSTVCNQEYRCGGNLIGRHTVTRNFSKGVHNGQDVTFVDVTKT